MTHIEPGQHPASAFGGVKVMTGAELLDRSFPERHWLIRGLLKERQQAMLYAPSGVGKSWMAWSLACMVAGGGGFHSFSNDRPARVLYLDGELDTEDCQERLAACITATGADPETVRKNLMVISRQDQAFDSRFVDLDDQHWQDAILTDARRLQVEFLVLDNFSTLVEVEDENSAAAFNGMTEFLLKMKQAGVSGLLVHHANKAGTSWRGSQKLSVTFDLVLSLTRPDTIEGDGCGFEMSFEKVRGNIDKTPVRLTLQSSGWAAEDSELAVAKAVRFLETGKYGSYQALADALGCSKSTVHARLKKAVQQGLLTPDGIKSFMGRASVEIPEAADETEEEPDTSNEF